MRALRQRFALWTIVVYAIPATACTRSDAPSDPAGSSGAASGNADDDGGDPTPGTAPDGGDDDDGSGGEASNDENADDGGSDDGSDDGLGPAEFDDGDLDPPSHGGTITFQEIGATGWYPSRRDPALGPCDAYDANDCCLAQHDVASDQLTPWDADLVLTLRGPMRVKQLAVYQPGDAGSWSLVSGWDERSPAGEGGLAFRGNDSERAFPGVVGTECLVDVSSDRVFECGDGSEPYCPASEDPHYYGWEGAKLVVLLAAMPHADDFEAPCSEDASGNWWDAPWVGLSLGELVRAGAFSSCQCYAKNPDEWWLGDGCGQFNVFEVVNDNNEFRNLDVFSTNFFGYGGYVGEGPCGMDCDLSMLAGEVDLVDKSTSTEASMGAVASPDMGPGAAFRRPALGYRYFVMLLDVSSRTVQLALVHPLQIPETIGGLLPALPGAIPQDTVDALLELRLPQ